MPGRLCVAVHFWRSFSALGKPLSLASQKLALFSKPRSRKHTRKIARRSSGHVSIVRIASDYVFSFLIVRCLV